MFTGLVEAIGTIQQVEPLATGRRITVSYASPIESVSIGDSVAVNGCCLTVVECKDASFSVEAGSETLARTDLGRLAMGSRVNLERALVVGDRMGGHFVSGHVDCVARLVERHDENDWSHFQFRLPQRWRPHLASKGSVALDGVSLTVVNVDTDTFSVALIPFTLAHTTLGQRNVGDDVNLETDLLAKYVESMLRS